MEDNRYVDRLYSVFDLPPHEGLDETVLCEREHPTRVMMFYDRAENRRTFQVFNRNLSKKDLRQIECWLRENSRICDTISGLNVPGV